MDMRDNLALVSGGASGLGLATVRAVVKGAGRAVIFDLPSSDGERVADELGPGVDFVPGDVTNADDVEAAVAFARERGELRLLVHTAGVGGPLRILDKSGGPGDLAAFERIMRVNLLGTFNVLRHSAAAMAALEPVNGERGICVLTSSIAAYDGRIGQVHYAASKSGIVGMTLPAARDLASKLIRVCTIAPGTFDTPLLARLSEEVRAGLAAEIPHPSRLGTADEYAQLALHVAANQMLNGEIIRLDGALRMSAR
ncbi:SDR family NAD(P)-dependent oxidoreductase [Rhodococcus sp. 14C212]|uniref:SDR family NAD(P)-dependent oxidoreductase n=1 Tax=Rhodococcus sp. 14C212 TaxID=2711209 RepID=UPI0013ECCA28|nr:SDR family NAD(P)-dependent oxidoreductase [Rhodococcus sp. 14C212]NGP08316.1 SDR family NAD(P)-dependent oxidoreductase [Rhodococcus sp. 14C212]